MVDQKPSFSEKNGHGAFFSRFAIGAIVGLAIAGGYLLYFSSVSTGCTKIASVSSVIWTFLLTVCCGFMVAKGSKLFWTFLNSLPPMP